MFLQKFKSKMASMKGGEEDETDQKLLLGNGLRKIVSEKITPRKQNGKIATGKKTHEMPTSEVLHAPRKTDKQQKHKATNVLVIELQEAKQDHVPGVYDQVSEGVRDIMRTSTCTFGESEAKRIDMDRDRVLTRLKEELADRKEQYVDKLSLSHCQSWCFLGISEKFIRLRVLDLSYMGLRSISGFPQIPTLCKLDLSHNELITGVLQLSGCGALKELDMSFNHDLSDLKELNMLKYFKRIRSISFTGCSVAQQSFYKFHVCRLLPSLLALDGEIVDEAFIQATYVYPSILSPEKNASSIKKNTQEGKVTKTMEASDVHMLSDEEDVFDERLDTESKPTIDIEGTVLSEYSESDSLLPFQHTK